MILTVICRHCSEQAIKIFYSKVIEIFSFYKREKNMYFEELYVLCDSIIYLLQKFSKINQQLSEQLVCHVDLSKRAKQSIEELIDIGPDPQDEISTSVDRVIDFTDSLRRSFAVNFPGKIFFEAPRLEKLPGSLSKVYLMEIISISLIRPIFIAVSRTGVPRGNMSVAL